MHFLINLIYGGVSFDGFENVDVDATTNNDGEPTDEIRISTPHISVDPRADCVSGSIFSDLPDYTPVPTYPLQATTYCNVQGMEFVNIVDEMYN